MDILLQLIHFLQQIFVFVLFLLQLLDCLAHIRSLFLVHDFQVDVLIDLRLLCFHFALHSLQLHLQLHVLGSYLFVNSLDLSHLFLFIPQLKHGPLETALFLHLLLQPQRFLLQSLVLDIQHPLVYLQLLELLLHFFVLLLPVFFLPCCHTQ